MEGVRDVKADFGRGKLVWKNEIVFLEFCAGFFDADGGSTSFREVTGGANENAGIIQAQGFICDSGEFESEAADSTAKVERADRPRSGTCGNTSLDREETLLANAFVEAQQGERDKWEGAKVPGAAVMEEQVLLQVAFGFVRVRHAPGQMATRLTKSVGW